MSVEFTDNSAKVKEAMNDALIAYLYEAGGELETAVKREAARDSGQTRNAWAYKVDESKGECAVGNPQENALWEEFGTGEHALEGKGRKSPWYIPVDSYKGKKKPTFQGKVVVVHGKDGIDFYKTDGKKPKRTLQTAFNKKKPKLVKRIGTILKEKLS